MSDWGLFTLAAALGLLVNLLIEGPLATLILRVLDIEHWPATSRTGGSVRSKVR